MKRSRIMYIEHKGDGRSGPARIGRVRLSNSGSTLYYRALTLQSLKGAGYKANYFEMDTREQFWVSGCKKGGDDTLYPGVVEIDEDCREEYWREIRGQPERVNETTVRSEGKYSKRRPK